MIAFWIAVVVGIVVGVVYIALAVQAFLRVRKDVLARASAGETDGATAELDVDALEDNNAGSFSWKAGAAVVASTSVIALLGVSPVFWYLPAILAIGSAVAVIAAFLIDRRSAE